MVLKVDDTNTEGAKKRARARVRYLADESFLVFVGRGGSKDGDG